MRALTTALLFLIAAATSPAWADAPERARGISVHMLPRRVADLGGRKWGLVVDYAEYLKPEPAQPVLQSPSELLAFTRKQDTSVQANGVWIVTTHPDAYSEQEKKLIDDIKAVCRKERIPLFIARASQLPAGWQRYDDRQ
ncbi:MULTISPECIES: hypothetical protein [unclassified Anaeromyxobacter]|uniref:hypothetical protein n=1 Tax=unclassified Anaeromyxobacter TaxID=2620896 RepID=UPI001F59EF10|nr:MULTISPECIES: hypothetical protein [unclassified Anaeromyxobacter]